MTRGPGIRTGLAAALIAVLVGGFSLVNASPAQAAASVTLLGRGFGHGRGMSQWGARGYAVDQGWTAEQILNRYYGGTRDATIGNPTLGVYLTRLDSNPGTWVTSTQEMFVGGTRVDAGSAFRLVRIGDTWQMFTSFNGCSPTDNYGPFPLPVNPLAVTAGDPGNDINRMLRVCAPSTAYRGGLRWVNDVGTTKVVNELPLDSYLRGVVPKEAWASWGDEGAGRGMAALEAQAVAARSYAWAESRWWFAKTCDTTMCQVYQGAATNGARNEDARTDRAVAATSGHIRADSGGRAVRAEFSSSSGGTTSPSFPVVNDLGDTSSKYYQWKVTIGGDAISRAYPSIGTFTRLEVLNRNGLGAQGGRVTQARVSGTRGSVLVTGMDFRLKLGLRSDWFFPVEQAGRVIYLKAPYSPVIYQEVWYGSWIEHYPITYDEWRAAGFPAPQPIYPSYEKYSWSPGIHGVIRWAGNPLADYQMLNWDQWRISGFPAPRNAGWISGTRYYKYASNPAIHAVAPDGVDHVLTWDQWQAAGFPGFRVI